MKSNDVTTEPQPEVLFDAAYGEFPKFLWYFVMPVLLVAAVVLYVRARWFGTGMILEGFKLSPNAVATIVCPVMWGLCALLIVLAAYRRRHPQQVLVTAEELVLPKGRFTDETIRIRWADLAATMYHGHAKFFEIYEVTCIDRQSGAKARIASMLFQEFDDFATFALLIGEHQGQNWSIPGFLPGTFRGRKD